MDNTYGQMLDFADRKCGLTVKEKNLWLYDGLIRSNNVAIRESIPTDAEKACVLAEEIGHYLTSAGEIRDYADPNSWKQEMKARTVGYGLIVTPDRLIGAYKAGCTSKYEIAEHIGCTEEFLDEAIERFRQIHGLYQRYGNYIIMYEPYLGIVKFNEGN